MKRILVFAYALLIFSFSGCTMQNETAIAQSQHEPNTTRTRWRKTKRRFWSNCSHPKAVRAVRLPTAFWRVLKTEQPNNEAEIITLALHVDYWNYLGWKDEFSSAAFSQRQSGYAEKFKLDSIYTPQMIVDGQTEFVGSNFENAQKSVTDAAKSAKAAIEITNANDKLKIKISDVPAHEDSFVWLAIAEDDLKTSVKSGENGGKVLNHVSVVRELKSLGNLAAADKSFETEFAVPINSAWKKNNLKFIVFVQGTQSKKIFGVKKLDN